MPDLPTLTVTAPQLTKLLTVFPGGANEYKSWLKNTLIDEVQRRSARAIDEESNAAKAAALAQSASELPARDEPAVEVPA